MSFVAEAEFDDTYGHQVFHRKVLEKPYMLNVHDSKETNIKRDGKVLVSSSITSLYSFLLFLIGVGRIYDMLAISHLVTTKTNCYLNK